VGGVGAREEAVVDVMVSRLKRGGGCV